MKQIWMFYTNTSDNRYVTSWLKKVQQTLLIYIFKYLYTIAIFTILLLACDASTLNSLAEDVRLYILTW